MSTKSERKRRVYEEKRRDAVNAAVAMSEPLEKLPNFNTDQLTNTAMDALAKDFECLSVECKHVEESRRDPHSDFYGYVEKAVVCEDGEIVGYAFIKSCAACANKTKDHPNIVARLDYMMLSDHTLKAMLKNPGKEQYMVPTSSYGKKLAADAQAEGPDSIN